MKPANGRTRARAFSLLEVITAVALLGILLVSIYTFITTIFDRETRALDEAARSQVAMMIFDRLEADLMTAVASAGGAAGLDGTPERLRIAHRAVLPGSPGAPSEDIQSTSIRFDPRSGVLILSRSGGGGGSSGIASAREPYPVPVRSARFRYREGESWLGRFNSANALPAAIELAIWFGESREPRESAPRAMDPVFAEGAGVSGDEPRDDDPFGYDAFGGNGPRAAGLSDDPFTDEDKPLGPPDRVRIITIPDASIPRLVRRELDAGGAP